MGIYQKGNNWYIDYYLRGQRKRKKVGPSKKLAEQVLKDVQVKIAKKEFLDIEEQKKILFEEFGKEYLRYSKTNKSPTSHRRDGMSMHQLNSVFGDRYLSEVTPHLIERYKAKRLETVKPATINRELACLKHMYTK